MLGHELRNPLMPIVTALALMRQRDDSVFMKERAIIERQARHMVRLIDDLLDVSRIVRGKLQLQQHPIEIRQVLLGAIETAGPIIEQNEHTLVVDVAERGLVVVGTPIPPDPDHRQLAHQRCQVLGSGQDDLCRGHANRG